LLLEYGADPNVRDTSRRTALHIAAWFGFPQIVRLLLAKEADIGAKDEWGATPLVSLTFLKAKLPIPDYLRIVHS